MSQAQYKMFDKKLIEQIEYFKNLDEIVPIGDILGDSSLNCTKFEFQKTLIAALEKYDTAFEIMRLR